MRGHDEQTAHMFSYLSPEQRVPADHPLRAVRALTDEALQTSRVQGVVATRPRWCESSSSLKASDGVFQPRVFRGRRLSVAATAATSLALCRLRSVPLGKYWRSRPLVFSFVPALPRTAGVAEEDVQPRVDTQLSVLGHLRALVPGQGPTKLIRERSDRRCDRIPYGFGAMPRKSQTVLDPESATFGHAG